MDANFFEGPLMIRILIIPLLCLALPALAGERSHATTREFQRLHPCPLTHLRTGTCPGYVKDHIVPLCAGGPDTPANMQWQTVKEAKVKDVQERRMCRHPSGV
jgi:hypothetical protein